MRIAHSSELVNIRAAAGSSADYASIKDEIETGRALLVEYHACYCVLRIDSDGLCVVCAQGKNLRTIAPYIVRLAKRLRTHSIVFHTQSRALSRLLYRYNFQYEMTDTSGYLIYRMVINYGQ